MELVTVSRLTRSQVCDRRGRIFLDGYFVDFETELETFRALASKYLKGNIREILTACADHPIFTVEAPLCDDPFRTTWEHIAIQLPANQGGG